MTSPKFHPVAPLRAGLPDLDAFARRVAGRLEAGTRGRSGVGPDDRLDPVLVTRAPGRLDVMGGIADYSGSLVLQWPIREATRVALRRWAEPWLSISSVGPDGSERRSDVPLDLVSDPGRPYDAVRAWFASDASRHWAAYVAGVFHVLVREQGVRFAGGAEILIESDVPEGKGVSSSAALEAATMEGVLGAWELTLEPKLRAIRCQQVENLVVGAPCGVMDQMTSICGEAGSLMALLCQPAEFQGSVKLPDELGVWGIDSGIRHAVTGADYGGVRVGAFMGYRILADLAGLMATPGERDGHVRIEDPRWHGYLANVGAETFQAFESRIPLACSGAAFLARYGGTTDVVTRVDPGRTYAVRAPTAHPIHEHERVTQWARLLNPSQPVPPSPNPSQRLPTPRNPSRPHFVRLGALMYESHASYSACGLGSAGTDLLVDLAREAGLSKGVYGAKITGGGSGGTVAILADRSAGAAVRAIARRYSERTGRDAYVFEGSSPGAARVGSISLRSG
jgi:galactokinase